MNISSARTARIDREMQPVGRASATQIITALCTPQRADDSLDVAALEIHINDQWDCGFSGVFIAGTMGQMQLQTSHVYHELVKHSVRLANGRGEVLVGIGDTCVSRTREHIEFACQFDIDGIVALCPYWVRFPQAELISYFSALADSSSKPLFLYDLPGATGTRLEQETIVALARHANIRGIKCSGPWEDTRQLMDVVPADFRVIPAQPHLVDHLIRVGVAVNLDGIFGILPKLTAGIVRAADNGEWTRAATSQKLLSQTLHLLRRDYAIYGGCEALLNARGIHGFITPAPLRRLTEGERERLLAEPVIKQVLAAEL